MNAEHGKTMLQWLRYQKDTWERLWGMPREHYDNFEAFLVAAIAAAEKPETETAPG